MAKSAQPPQRHLGELSKSDIEKAIPRLRKRITELENLDPNQLRSRSAPELIALRASIDDALTSTFDHGTIEYQRYRSAAQLDCGPVVMASSWIAARGGGEERDEFREHLEESRQRSIALLKQAIVGLEEKASELPTDTASIGVAKHRHSTRRVFVVHGHHEGARESVARFLERIGFEPIILHEQANKGRTLITKFQEEAEDAGFAVVLMSADDVGSAVGKEPRPRARQNVIFELGFFVGALGAHRVAALVDTDIERPSDYEGVVYIPLAGDWKLPLAKELEAAGFEVDWNLVIRG